MKRLSEMNETHWGGMIKRSSSDVKRKEDNVNGLDIEEFFEYLENRYSFVGEGGLRYCSTYGSFIRFPLFRNGDDYKAIQIDFKDGIMSRIRINTNKKEQ